MLIRWLVDKCLVELSGQQAAAAAAGKASTPTAHQNYSVVYVVVDVLFRCCRRIICSYYHFSDMCLAIDVQLVKATHPHV